MQAAAHKKSITKKSLDKKADEHKGIDKNKG
jgi:hypothetical protein